MGLNDGGLPPDLLDQVVERAHNRPGRPHGRWLPRAIASHGGQGLSNALLDIVAWYATEDPDSEIRRAAGDWRQPIREEKRIEPVLPMAGAFVESPAFAETAESFFWAIEEVVDASPNLLLRAGHRFVELAGAAAGDLRESRQPSRTA